MSRSLQRRAKWSSQDQRAGVEPELDREAGSSCWKSDANPLRADHAGLGQRQDVAGADEAAVAAGGAAAERAALDDRDAPAGPGEIIGARRADDAAADDDHGS